MSVYTYVVKHKDPPPEINFKNKVEGGELMGFMFDDALEHIGLLEALIDRIQASTDCIKTSEAIDLGMVEIDKARIKRTGTWSNPTLS